MITARLFSAVQPVAPTTAAIAPNAPIGAAHMIMARTRKTSRCRCSTPRRIGAPFGPSACSANPTSSATSSVCSTWPSVSAETSVVGMIPSRKSTGAARRRLAWASAAFTSARVEVQAGAGVDDVADDQADGQRDGRHDEEVAQRQAADLADLGRLADRADAEHDGAEDDRADHHLDQVDEAVAERLQLLGEAGDEQARPRSRATTRRSRPGTGSGSCPGAAVASVVGARHRCLQLRGVQVAAHCTALRVTRVTCVH